MGRNTLSLLGMSIIFHPHGQIVNTSAKVKKRNLGKGDGLILVRTLLHKYASRYENPVSSMGDNFFRWFCEFAESCPFSEFEWLVGVDADTTSSSTCIYEMHGECLKHPKLIGCSGHIQGTLILNLASEMATANTDNNSWIPDRTVEPLGHLPEYGIYPSIVSPPLASSSRNG
jgi:hypothetical protein